VRLRETQATEKFSTAQPKSEGARVDQELEIISDGDGLAIFGNPAAIEVFLARGGVESREINTVRVGNVVAAGAGTAEAGAGIAAMSGRWVQLSEKSAHLTQHGNLMKGSADNLQRAIVTQNGKTAHIVEFTKGGISMLANPAVLTGAAGIMAQIAMQQTMDEIIDYLKVLDEKLDDVKRAQKDEVLAELMGARMVLEEALSVRDRVGTVSEVTWSKVSETSLPIATTQANALRKLEGIAQKMERKAKVGDLADYLREAEGEIREWLVVLAECSRLHEASGVLELERVMVTAPHELDSHREGLRLSREKRTAAIASAADALVQRVLAAAALANAKVLLHPQSAKQVVSASSAIAADLAGFASALSLDLTGGDINGRRWIEAATDAKEKVVETSGTGLNTAKGFSIDAFERGKSVGGSAASGLAARAKTLRRRDPRTDGE